MKTRSALTRPLIIAVTLATTFSLTGCFSSPIENFTHSSVDDASEESTEAPTVTGVDGEIPDDFPSEVPLWSEKVTSSTAIVDEEASGWTVVLQAGNPKTTRDEIRAQLEGAGFVQESWGSVGLTTYTGTYVSGRYEVTVETHWSEGEEETSQVTYTVIDLSTAK